MTPHEKALELKEIFNNALSAKECAFACVDEIINEINIIEDINPTVYEYWKEVIKEIDKL